jgi:hypothetical protein
VPSLALDLCVFNSDGLATMQINSEAPAAIRPAWKARHEKITESVQRLMRRLDLLMPIQGESRDVQQIKAQLKQELSGELLNGGLFKGKVIDQNGLRSISYNCRRVGRLARSHAFGLLMAYTACLSRPAYERDFG